jgi:hypothetical protein
MIGLPQVLLGDAENRIMIEEMRKKMMSEELLQSMIGNKGEMVQGKGAEGAS